MGVQRHKMYTYKQVVCNAGWSWEFNILTQQNLQTISFQLRLNSGMNSRKQMLERFLEEILEQRSYNVDQYIK